MPVPKKQVHKDGSVRWKVRFRDSGRSASETFVTKKAANDFCKLLDAVGGTRARAIINEIERDDVMAHTVGDVAAKWLAWMSEKRSDGTLKRDLAPYTLTRYEQLVRLHILPTFGSMPTTVVSETDVQDWVDRLDDTLAAKTVADAHSVLHQIYKWALDRRRNLAIFDPCTITDLPRRPKNQAKGLHPAEWAILHRAALEVDQDAADLLLFLVASQWRFSEAAALASLSVDDFGDSMAVSMGRVLRRTDDNRFVIVEGGKSQAAVRRVAMPTAAADMIRRRRANLGPNDLLFTTNAGKPWRYSWFHSGFWTYSKLSTDTSTTRKRILQRAHELGLDRAPEVTIHWLRHTGVAMLLLSGESLPAVQKRVGHESIKTTVGVYGSLISDVSTSGLSALDRALGAGSEPDASGAAALPITDPA